ncbi:MAG TPA: hypothetical protein P5514_01220 [Bacteroidales bacterium]|nr:hypothetical protein [Bacteroidales bacterium]HRX95536.1 hypothetical protein [Bacteroidales bacterium]
MKKSLFVLFVICFALGINYSKAQDSLKLFDLSRYKLPDLKRQQLDIQTNLGTALNIDDDHNDNRRINRSYTSANLAATYRLYRNSRKYQGDQILQNSSIIYHYKYDDFQIPYPNISKNDKSESDDFRNFLDLQSYNRFYFNGLNFVEVSPYVTGEIYNSKSSSDQNLFIYNSKSRERNIEIELPLYYGFGRIERVEDARQVLFILQDQQRFGRLNRMPSGDEIIALSKRASSVKNQRFFDSRLQRIDELKTIDEGLREMGLVNNDDIVYYTSLSDMWDYGDIDMRYAGYRFNIGVQPSYSLVRQYNFEEYNYDSNNNDLYIGRDETTINSYRYILSSIMFEYQKPINQKWQYWLTTNGFIGPSEVINKIQNEIDDTTTQTSLNLINYALRIRTGLGFYPNTRTYATASFNGSYEYYKGTFNESDNEQNSKSNLWEMMFTLQSYYYISPRLRLNARYSYYFSHLIGTNSLNNYNFSQTGINSNNLSILEGENYLKNIDHSFIVTLTYSIF